MSHRAYGSIEYAVIAFPGNHFTGEIAEEISKLISQGIVRVIDLTVIRRDADGSTDVVELESLEPAEAALFSAISGEGSGLLSQEDLANIAEEIPPNNSAAILVWENVWAAALAKSMQRADGILVAHERVPAEIVEAVLGDD